MKRRHSISFVHAIEGVWYAVRTQPNFIIHLAISTFAILAGWVFGLSRLEWAVITVLISVGLVIELINTSIESVVDLATGDVHHLAKVAKDCASGAMLVYAFGASIAAAIIYLPKLWLYF